MKKITLALIFIGILSTIFVFAEDDFVLSTIPQLDIKDPNTIEKMDIYTKMKIDPFLPILLNGIVGFGSGSFAQNDILFGIIGFAGDAAGLSITFSAILTLQDTVNIYVNRGPAYLQLTAGIGIYLISKVIEFIRPGIFAYDYNKKLWNSLFNH